jgi:hypothetical protein
MASICIPEYTDHLVTLCSIVAYRPHLEMVATSDTRSDSPNVCTTRLGSINVWVFVVDMEAGRFIRSDKELFVLMIALAFMSSSKQD